MRILPSQHGVGFRGRSSGSCAGVLNAGFNEEFAGSLAPRYRALKLAMTHADAVRVSAHVRLMNALVWLRGFVWKPWVPDPAPSVVVQRITVIAAGICTLVSGAWFLTANGSHDVEAMILFGVMVAIGNQLVIPVPKMSIQIACGDMFFLVALLHLSAPDAAGLVLCATFAKLLLDRRSIMSALMFVAWPLNSALLANAVLHAAFGVGSPATAGVTYVAAGVIGYVALVAVGNAEMIISSILANRASEQPVPHLQVLATGLRQAAALEGSLAVANVPLAVLGCLAYDREPWLALLLLVPFAGILYVMSRTVALEEVMARSQSDFLTGLLNRYGLMEKGVEMAQTAKVEGDACAVLVGDIDFFKRVNDKYGHAVGDEALRLVGEVFQRGLEGVHCAASRYGGEEFVVVLPGMHEDMAARLAEQLRMQVGLKLQPWGSSISIGVAWDTDGGLKSAIERADRAMYHAKSDGKNCIYIWPEADDQPSRLDWTYARVA